MSFQWTIDHLSILPLFPSTICLFSSFMLEFFLKYLIIYDCLHLKVRHLNADWNPCVLIGFVHWWASPLCDWVGAHYYYLFVGGGGTPRFNLHRGWEIFPISAGLPPVFTTLYFHCYLMMPVVCLRIDVLFLVIFLFRLRFQHSSVSVNILQFTFFSSKILTFLFSTIFLLTPFVGPCLFNLSIIIEVEFEEEIVINSWAQSSVFK